MEMIEHYVTMQDGHEIFVRHCIPERLKGHIHLLHGMAEHSERYLQFANMLVELGYLVSMHDHRGHGKTVERNGVLGHYADENGFNLVVDDVAQVLAAVRRGKEYPKPILFGHSMGSFIVRRYLQLYSEDVHSAILCGTGSTTPIHAAGNALANLLSQIQGANVPSKMMNALSFGSFNKQVKNPKTKMDWLSRDEVEVQKYIEDPLCGFIPTNQFFADLTKGLLLIAKNEELVKVRHDIPLLFISGSDDPVGGNGKGVFKVANSMRKAGVENVAIHIFEEMRHEILNEKNKQHVYDVIRRWLKENEQ